MSYQCGVGLGFPGINPRVAQIICDTCGLSLTIQGKGAGRNIAPAWLTNNRAPKGWRLRMKDGKRVDTCPFCVNGESVR